jgi:hypothetical protein
LFVFYGFSRGLLFGKVVHRTDQLAFKWVRLFIDGFIGFMPRVIVKTIIRPTPLAIGQELEKEKKTFCAAAQILGDQQLVIGLGFLLGGFSDPCSVSGYGLKNLVAMSWLSCIAHISTMVVIGRYDSSLHRLN